MSPAPYENPSAEADFSQPVNLAQPAADTTLSDAWVTLRKRKYIILALGLVGAVYGWRQGAIQPRLYDSAGTIEIRSGSSNEYRLSNISGVDSTSRIPTEAAILKSDGLLLSVARDLNLANNQYFMGPSRTYRNIDDPVIRQQAISNLQTSVGVASIPHTDIVRISCSTLNAQLSADIVNKLVHEYILHSFQSRADASQRVTEFFTRQLDELKQEVQTSQEQMIDLQKRLGVLGFDPTLNQTTLTLSELSKAVGVAEVNRIAAETRYKVLNNTDPTLLDSSGEPGKLSSVANIRIQIQNLRAQLAQLNANYGPNNPKVIALQDQIRELNKQITEEQERILSDSKQGFIAAQTAETETRSALDTEKTDAYKLRDDLLEYTLRQRQFESNRLLYDGLLQKLRTAGVQAGLESTEIDILDPAVPALGPSLKPKSTAVILNTAIMVILGIVIAFILDSMDSGLRSVSEIETISGLPSLALIPRGRRSNTEGANLTPAMRNLGTLSSPKSQFSESFRALRTSLLLSVAGGRPKIILLTSATPSEGKTTVSINLACVLAQSNVRVLLIDADLRRPTVHHRFGLNGKVGLTSVLTGTLTLEQAIQNVPEISNLDILVSGPVPPFPTEMLGSQTMRDLLNYCRGIYTHIVMDSPPLLSVTDSVVLARDADAVVMIVRHGKSSRHAVRRGRDLLVRSGAAVTGIVMNSVDLNSPEYYAYYGYYGYSGYAAAGVDSAGWEAQNGGKNDIPNGDAEAPPAPENPRKGGSE